MKILTFFLLVTTVFSAQAQFTDKGLALLRGVRLFVKNAEIQNYTPIYSYTICPSTTVFDTIYYEMGESDTVQLLLSMIDEVGFYPEDFDFNVQLIHGTPLFLSIKDNSNPHTFRRDTKMILDDAALISVCGNGDGIVTHIFKLTKDQKNVPEETVYSKISVYPNPAVDVLNIELKSNVETSFSLINSAGILIRKWSRNESHQEDLSDLEDGVYLLQVADDKQSYVIKINKT